MIKMRSLTRGQAARMLRETRKAIAASDPNASELVGWLFAAMKERASALRLKIDYLIQTHQYDSADALLAKCIMHGEDHPRWRRRLAQSLFDQGRIEQAAVEIDHALRLQPHHTGVLILAGEIAAKRDEWNKAITCLVRVCDRCPSNTALNDRLVRVLLDAGLVERAAEHVATHACISTALAARVLRRQGRVLEARELLEHAALDDANVGELVDLLDDAGDVPRLRSLLPKGGDFSPATRLHMASALVSFGAFEDAACVLEGLQSGDSKSMSLHVQLQAFESVLTLKPYGGANPKDYRSNIARIWLRAMMGRTIKSHIEDPTSLQKSRGGVLADLLKKARRILSDASDSELNAHVGSELRELADRCRSALAHSWVAKQPASSVAASAAGDGVRPAGQLRKAA